MLYNIGTISQLEILRKKITAELFELLNYEVSVLDDLYGSERNIFNNDGGYCIVAEAPDDLLQLHLEFITFESAEHIGKYMKLIYVCNNEFTVSVYFPYEITPYYILNEL